MPEGRGYQRLKAQTSLEDILVVATEFERTARDFYAGLVPKVSKQIRYLVEELAREEQQHFDLFTELLARSDIAGQVKQSIKTPASDRRFSDCIHLPELGDHPDDQAVLQYALGREHAAMEQYRSLAESTPPGPIRDLFQYLADEETQHKNELEKRYYEIVHSGGV
ncbi:MAG: ferritin family protein [Chromatiales bacterium]